jgi:hypothetical protein
MLTLSDRSVFVISSAAGGSPDVAMRILTAELGSR